MLPRASPEGKSQDLLSPNFINGHSMAGHVLPKWVFCSERLLHADGQMGARIDGDQAKQATHKKLDKILGFEIPEQTAVDRPRGVLDFIFNSMARAPTKLLRKRSNVFLKMPW